MPLYFTIIALILIISIIIFVVRKSRAKPTLYTRLGGVFGIAKVVDHFSDALIDNPVVGKASKNPFLADWSQNKLDRLPGLKFMRTLWLCALSGGPFKYVATRQGKCPFSLENAHKGLVISPEEFDAVAAELSKSLDFYNVPGPEKSEVLAAFSAHKNEVIMGYNIVNNIKVAPIRC